MVRACIADGGEAGEAVGSVYGYGEAQQFAVREGLEAHAVEDEEQVTAGKPLYAKRVAVCCSTERGIARVDADAFGYKMKDEIPMT